MGIFSAIPQELLSLVLPLYTAPERHYHNWGHIRSMWQTAADLNWKLGRAEQLAVLCHDLVYVPGAPAGENERNSVARMKALIAERNIDVPPYALRDAEEIILATVSHEQPTDRAARVCDLDLAVLAAGPAEWRRYRDNIRAEYSHLSDAAFLRGSRAFFKALLARSAIYQTPEAQKRFENRARTNITKELELLNQQDLL